jgi:hypothetical protein
MVEGWYGDADVPGPRNRVFGIKYCTKGRIEPVFSGQKMSLNTSQGMRSRVWREV